MPGPSYGDCWHESLTRFSRSRLTTPHAVGEGEARRILEGAIRHEQDPTRTADTTRDYPMLHYTLGYLYELDGDRARAKSEYIKRRQGRSSICLPTPC